MPYCEKAPEWTHRLQVANAVLVGESCGLKRHKFQHMAAKRRAHRRNLVLGASLRELVERLEVIKDLLADRATG